MADSRKSVCFVVSTILTARVFLRQQLAALAEQYDVVVVANEADARILRKDGIPVDVIMMPIERGIGLRKDLQALWLLFRFFRARQFDAVHSVTPKAGLLAAIAGWLARVPLRMHTFTGQVWVTHRGTMRTLLKSLDTLTARLNHQSLVDSESQRQFLIRESVVAAARSMVLANGSICGVDETRFCPNEQLRRQFREELGLEENDVLLLYLGRINQDKGILDLATAFRELAAKYPQAHLLLVGPDEGGLTDTVRRLLKGQPDNLHIIGFTGEPENFMRAADIFCLPSYREGFGSVVIEAACCGTPAVASRIYGITDAIEEHQTGLLHEPGNVAQLTEALEQLTSDAGLRSQMGDAARARALKLFPSTLLTSAMLDLYQHALGNHSDCEAPV